MGVIKQTVFSCLGTFIRPTSFTLTGLLSQNGSDANGGSPSMCGASYDVKHGV